MEKKVSQAFSSDEDFDEKPKVRLKGMENKNNNSPAAKQAIFEERASEHFSQQEKTKSEIVNLAQKFIQVMSDQTLKGNKGEIAKNYENQVINDLVSLGQKMNNDPLLEEEGTGSIGLIVLLFKTVLSQRDKINDLSFRLKRMEEKSSGDS